jgi:NAD(P)-dependent dehydrogenase (short-subunit alcohol dehydrogenase family)
MELGSKDRTAIVTGSTRGIGKAVAASLLEEGATAFIRKISSCSTM